MTHLRFYLASVAAAALAPFAFSAVNFPPESEAWLSVHFSYPFFQDKQASFLGRVGPGFEIHSVDHEKKLALVVLFPNGSKPRKRYLQHDGFTRFMRDWERIGLLSCSKSVFQHAEIRTIKNGREVIQSLPFDDRTLIVSIRENGKESSISIYAPEFCIEALKDRPEGKILRETMDVLFRLVGEVTL
jgi:hypothetical protein